MSDHIWELVWEDGFDTTGSPDPEKWNYEISGPLKTEAFELFHNYIAKRKENSRCENSCLVIEARKENYNGTRFTSASLFSRSAWKYVRIEVKAKLPYGTGIWPAIWMLPEGFDGEGWPSCGEIDIAEHIGQKVQEVFFNVNTGAYNIVNGKAKGKHLYITDLYTRFHVFRIDWTAESIQFFMNDELTFEFQKESNDPEVWPFDKPFYLKLMLAVGLLYDYGDGIKEVDTTVFPQQLLIDYVRVYKGRTHDTAF